MSKEVIVGIAEANVIKAPGNIITIGLGSCIGISLYDSQNKIAGLAHIMLPDSNNFSNKKNLYKYADTAIPMLLSKMERMGSFKKHIKAKIVGGAQMFKSQDKNLMSSDIGGRNARAVEKTLKNLEIELIAKEIGGNKGRTMIVNSETGVITIRSLGKNIIEI